ncbi:MAG: carboxymuconolactone decarboxylase family protein [Candidatus Thiodiazotropha sp. (ex Lucinoma borealis)]|nr:carboxymuconolactone decarboxylase family protein [Candidatus Thiodiazotropha sp. (ex Lucinoma borealis)]
MSRLAPLPIEHAPELQERFAFFEKTLGFVPNSLLTMQRKPKLVDAFIQFSAQVYDPNGEVDLGFKRLVANVASSAAGCQYCRAHTAVSAKRHGVAIEKLEDLWNYRNSEHYSEAAIVEILAVIGLFGFFNRWNDSLATPLEAEPMETAQAHLAKSGWKAGKHTT